MAEWKMIPGREQGEPCAEGHRCCRVRVVHGHRWRSADCRCTDRAGAPVTPGTRVRFNERCPWPERVGCAGVVVAPRPDGAYPQPGPGEVLVLLSHDPLASHLPDSRWWTCSTNRDGLDVLAHVTEEEGT